MQRQAPVTPAPGLAAELRGSVLLLGLSLGVTAVVSVAAQAALALFG